MCKIVVFDFHHTYGLCVTYIFIIIIAVMAMIVC